MQLCARIRILEGSPTLVKFRGVYFSDIVPLLVPAGHRVWATTTSTEQIQFECDKSIRFRCDLGEQGTPAPVGVGIDESGD